MRKFFKNLILFLLPLMVFFIIAEGGIIFLRNRLFSEKVLEGSFVNEIEKSLWVNCIDHPKKVLLIGSSSVRYGLDCNLLNELSNDSLIFLNLGMDARDPVEVYFILKDIDLSSVHSIYLGFDPWIYAKRYYKYRNKIFYLDFDLMEAVEYSQEHDKTAFIVRYRMLFESLFKLIQGIDTLNLEINCTVPENYGSVKLKQVPLNFNEPISNWFQLEKYGWSRIQFEYLLKIEELCKLNDIDFYSFVPPKRSDFSEIYKRECSSIHGEFIEMLDSSGYNAPIFGYFNQLDSLGDFNLFAEPFHLNEKGQEVYSGLFYKMMTEDKLLFNKYYLWLR